MYSTPEAVEKYVAMAEGHNGLAHIQHLCTLLPTGSDVLELGMGPGVDTDMMLPMFSVVGSDNSPSFLDRYRASHPGADVLELDAVTIATDRRFDCVYSNKVLHHLTVADFTRSLARQAEVLRPKGLLMHGLWAGTGSETHCGMFVQSYTPETLAQAVPPMLEVVECTSYKEFDDDDSLRVVLRRKE